ncbi:MAG: hypothetical protein CMJ32_07660 [Phycisphaerae bacterium]|nr:hypothetical protein [Phycisphaerae bacterium]
MPDAYDAGCSDFYINQKIALKMDLPSSRETVMDLFDRVRRELPAMDQFRRFDDELALESSDTERNYSWLAMRRTSVRSGWVNPSRINDAYHLHGLVLETAPYFLSISPLDVEYIELVYGFDMEAQMNRDEVVFDALLANSPLAGLIDHDRESVVESQPLIGMGIDEMSDLKAYVEIKSRSRAQEGSASGWTNEPISVYLTVRKAGPLQHVDDFKTIFGMLCGTGERLVDERVIPSVLMPLRQAILSRPC